MPIAFSKHARRPGWPRSQRPQGDGDGETARTGVDHRIAGDRGCRPDGVAAASQIGRDQAGSHPQYGGVATMPDELSEEDFAQPTPSTQLVSVPDAAELTVSASPASRFAAAASVPGADDVHRAQRQRLSGQGPRNRLCVLRRSRRWTLCDGAVAASSRRPSSTKKPQARFR